MKYEALRHRNDTSVCLPLLPHSSPRRREGERNVQSGSRVSRGDRERRKGRYNKPVRVIRVTLVASLAAATAAPADDELLLPTHTHTHIETEDRVINFKENRYTFI